MNKNLMEARRLELNAITIILDRADKLHLNTSRISLMMDIEYSNVNVVSLAMADDATFNHDVTGIFNNFNRTTKQLENCFVPRVGFKKCG